MIYANDINQALQKKNKKYLEMICVQDLSLGVPKFFSRTSIRNFVGIEAYSIYKQNKLY